MEESYYWLPFGLLMAGIFTYLYIRLPNGSKKNTNAPNDENQSLSTFEMAKRLGFVGSEEEWLAALPIPSRSSAVMSNCYWLDEDPDAVSIRPFSYSSYSTPASELDPAYPNPNETFEEWETRSLIRGLAIEKRE